MFLEKVVLPRLRGPTSKWPYVLVKVVLPRLRGPSPKWPYVLRKVVLPRLRGPTPKWSYVLGKEVLPRLRGPTPKRPYVWVKVVWPRLRGPTPKIPDVLVQIVRQRVRGPTSNRPYVSGKVVRPRLTRSRWRSKRCTGTHKIQKFRIFVFFLPENHFFSTMLTPTQLTGPTTKKKHKLQYLFSFGTVNIEPFCKLYWNLFLFLSANNLCLSIESWGLVVENNSPLIRLAYPY